ncbi:ribose-phosphate pyrophosphokinase [Candidatus Woesearchaeota archaeon]|nr:ribose-phosphate pyrophosphokinase [Candidatus Woesearchaeota archaeon]
MSRGLIGIIACNAGKPFATKVTEELAKIRQESQLKLIIPTKEYHFANTEIKTELLSKVRGMDIYIIQDVENSTIPQDQEGSKLKQDSYSVDENLRALKTAVYAAKICGAQHIAAVLPVFPYSRQDKQQAREAITAALIAREIEIAGADSIITMDIHNLATAGFFKEAVFINLFGSRNLIPYIRQNLNLSNLIVVAPDEGGVKRASFFARILQTRLAIMHKERDYSTVNEVTSIKLLGEVNNKDVLLVDDMIDTAGTLVTAARTLKQQGAKNIYFCTSLACLNPPALERLDILYKEGILTQLITTDAIFHGNLNRDHPWYTEVTVADYFAQVIHTVNTGESVSRLLQKQ